MTGLLLDTRDDEFNPSRGGYQELSMRAGGGPSDDRSMRYLAVYAHTRWFIPLVKQYLVLALRGLGDVGFGAMPLLELGSIGGYFQIAGPAGIEANRGLPYGRQLGRIKLLATTELRSTFWRFAVGSQRFALGAAAFVDASRVWSQWGGTPGLDGGPLARVSFGGGPRLTWGRALVLRVDVGVGPGSGVDGANNVSGTLALGQVF
jgi:outer membrane protein assembly factor BamA